VDVKERPPRPRATAGSFLRPGVTPTTGRDEWEVLRIRACFFPVWAPAYAIGDTPFGLEAYPGREGQLDLVLWSERIRAVIAGDTLIDLGNGREIPASWLPEGVTVEQVAGGLRPLLEKPVECVLPTHGEPTDRAALEHALS
jgi:hypothetical protein